MALSLNAAQAEAVQATEGPVRIIAGAGTGKTRTLVARIEHLVNDKGIPAHEVLALTFTHKAARELNERLIACGLPRVQATTFHGLAAHMLRCHFRSDFSILSAEEQEECLRDVLYSRERDELKEVVSDFNTVRQAAACGAPWPALLSSVTLERLAELFQMFRGLLEEKNALDFTGLLTTLLELWNSDPDIQAACQARYRYVLVDEYQDVSPLQIELVQRLCAGHRNVCVVGDPDQTIYSWRGARASTMADFMMLYPEAVSITLTQNYRNTASILAGAEALIRCNTNRPEKILESTLSGGMPVHLWESRDEWQMNETLFHLLERWVGSHDHMAQADHTDRAGASYRSFGELALLYRTQAEGRLLAAHLSQKGYPFQISTLPHFWGHKDVRRFLEKLEAVRRIGLPTGGAGGHGDTDGGHGDGGASAMGRAGAALFSDWFRAKLEEFVWHQSIPEKKAIVLRQLLPHAMAFDAFELPEALSRFLDSADTAEDVDNLVLGDRINLLTLHAAKGLEFPIVMIFGLEEGLLPHQRAGDDPYWVEEERRLLYVGMTRAKEELHLFRKCAVDGKPREASRFIAEIGPEHLTRGALPAHRAIASRRKQVKKAQLTMF